VSEYVVEGPFFDDLHVGDVFAGAPALTLTDGLAAAHRAIVGDRMRLALDHPLCEAVVGRGPIAHPSLVWDVSIGQSTLATQRVKANVFYRGLAFHRMPVLGDTLSTVTRVVSLRQNSRQPRREPTGLAALRVETLDQQRRLVLTFWRCAMLPLRGDWCPDAPQADLSDVGSDLDESAFGTVVSGWRLGGFRKSVTGRHFDALVAGDSWMVDGGDVVSSAPELARLTLNVAKAHHDAGAAGGARLVYGGHTIGIALAQATRALPDLVTVAGWHGCEHLAPVFEGDTLFSVLVLERTQPLPGGGLAHLRSRVRAVAPGADEFRDVLDWRFVGVFS
jgi:acyl dehydratase